MAGTIFLRSTRAGDQLEIFFVSAITSLLAVRFYLHATGYPQVGGGSFHIAHMLYGGFFMLAAIVLQLSYLGQRIERTTAILGGIGFGVFIDELGKFITKDNDYFYQPTVALIYIVFIGLFLVFQALGRQQGYTKREYLLNGLLQLEEAALHDMDSIERERALSLLQRADQDDPLTQRLMTLVDELEPEAPARANIIVRFYRWLRTLYDRLIETTWARRLIVTFFIVDSIYLVISANMRLDLIHFAAAHQYTALSQLASSIIAASLIIVGIVRLRRSRYVAYEYFRRALLVTIFVTEFFDFYREEFNALGGFFINLLAFIALRYALAEERRLLRERG